MTNIAIFGLGEAGSLIGADLAAAGFAVSGYDPAPVATPSGVTRFDDPAQAVRHADAVLAITAQADAVTAARQALGDIPATALYADLSTASAGLKRRLAEILASHGIEFADIALMATVPGKGLRTPALASGAGAQRFVSMFAPAGMPVEAIGADPGAAATRKLLRSVMMKGLAAVVIESLRAGDRAGCADWLWRNLADEITGADAALLARLVRGTGTHAKRRLHEMEASAALLAELGVDPIMTRATVESLRRVRAEGIPSIPGNEHTHGIGQRSKGKG
jgi:3-hydroxyisobutyrate dehydrogenase-like beta-hydroxyacid dehydrogenase